jgi:alanyl-tRNA synthetase
VLESLQTSAKNIQGVTFIAEKVEVANAELLKKLAYDLRTSNKELFAVLGAEIEGKAMLAVMISDDVVANFQLHAGNIIKELGRHIDGGGGGQAHFATAGGKNPGGLAAALEAAKGYMKD